MKRALSFVVLCLVALPAMASPARYLSESQNLSASDPSASTEGMGLSGVRGMRVSVCANNGQTLSGSGSLKAWLYDTDAGLWMRDPSADLTVNASSVRCQVFPDLTTYVHTADHRVAYRASSVTVSSGTTVTVRIVAEMER